MIYEFPDEHAPIRQGDIFEGLPLVEVSLTGLLLIDSGGQFEANWSEVAGRTSPLNAICPIRSVTAIVMNQDCDTVHGQDITLCEIRQFRDVEGKAKQTKSAKKVGKHSDAACAPESEVVLSATKFSDRLFRKNGGRLHSHNSVTSG